MPLWGTRDTKTVTGTITIPGPDLRAVVGSGTAFTTELKPGQTLVIAGVEYQIASILSNTSLRLRIPYSAVLGTATTVTANEQPAYLSQLGPNNTIATSDLPITFGISVPEAQLPQNRAKGINTPGWVQYRTYTDAQGQTRNKSVSLVAFGGTGITGDADTTTFPEVPTITTQPADTTSAAGAASFTVVASALNSGTLSYQWQKQESNGTTWANVGTNSATLSLTGLTNAADNGDKYRVVITASVGSGTVTSRVATLTVP